MILKYALFTLLISLFPLILIIHDKFGCIPSFFSSLLPSTSLTFEFVNNVLHTGVFTYLLGGDIYYASIKSEKNEEVLFTKYTLEKFNGQNGYPLYLAILGNVFDVSKAAKYYGPGETYNAFVGRDGSRAFITGDFTNAGLTDIVDDLSFQDLRSLNDWLRFYHKEYSYKGKVIGRYYDQNGKQTGYSHKVNLKIEEAEKNERNINKYKELFPPCNVEWTPEQGSRVWCTTRSGGINRDWIGVPRKLYEPGAKSFRCACINDTKLSQVNIPDTGKGRTGNIEEYEDCHPKSHSCYISLN